MTGRDPNVNVCGVFVEDKKLSLICIYGDFTAILLVTSPTSVLFSRYLCSYKTNRLFQYQTITGQPFVKKIPMFEMVSNLRNCSDFRNGFECRNCFEFHNG